MPFSAVDFLQAFAAGILVGSAYALMCIGLGIIFGAMRVINFAQGDFLMLGMYAAFYLTTGFGVLAFLGPARIPVPPAASRTNSVSKSPSTLTPFPKPTSPSSGG